MAKSTGIVLTAGSISFANEWVLTNKPNFRIIIATGGAALLITGIESLNERLGIGFGVLMLITVLITPVNGSSPLQTVGALPAIQNPGSGPPAPDAVLAGNAADAVAGAFKPVAQPVPQTHLPTGNFRIQ